MLALKAKDLKARKLFFKKAKKRVLLKFIIINILATTSKFLVNTKLKLKLLNLQLKLKKTSKVRIKNRCILTNRNKGVNKYYGVSRIVMRNLLQFGIIPGYTKAVW